MGALLTATCPGPCHPHPRPSLRPRVTGDDPSERWEAPLPASPCTFPRLLRSCHVVSLAPVRPSPQPRGHVPGRSPASRDCSSTPLTPYVGIPSSTIHDTPVRPTPLPPACASRPAEVWPPPRLPHRASPPEQTAGSPVSGRPLGLGWGGGGHWLGASEGACHSTPTNRAGRDPSRTRASGRTGTCGEPPPCHPPRSALPQPRRSPNV